MSEIIGNALNICIARTLGVLRVSHLGDETCYDGEDYVTDLNAMHEAEKVMTDAQYLVYTNIHLSQTTNHEQTGRIISATAKQRAEAFIKTMDS